MTTLAERLLLDPATRRILDAGPRRCAYRAYCNALRACGYPAPQCPFCAAVDVALALWGGR